MDPSYARTIGNKPEALEKLKMTSTDHKGVFNNTVCCYIA